MAGEKLSSTARQAEITASTLARNAIRKLMPPAWYVEAADTPEHIAVRDYTAAINDKQLELAGKKVPFLSGMFTAAVNLRGTGDEPMLRLSKGPGGLRSSVLMVHQPDTRPIFTSEMMGGLSPAAIEAVNGQLDELPEGFLGVLSEELVVARVPRGSEVIRIMRVGIVDSIDMTDRSNADAPASPQVAIYLPAGIEDVTRMTAVVRGAQVG